MLSKRLIACLDVRDGRVVKGVNFKDLRHAGDPAALARRYNAEGIDELVILDVTATIEGRRALRRHDPRACPRELFIPLAVGGGIRSRGGCRGGDRRGADKVSLNTAALADPSLHHAAGRAVRQPGGRRRDRREARRRSIRRVRAERPRRPTRRDAVEWAREAADRGAGEILLTSIDRDGTRSGFDCELTAAVSSAVTIPVIASGGAGTFEHFVEVFTRGQADAALAASVFHFSEHAVSELKRHLRAHGVPVRL